LARAPSNHRRERSAFVGLLRVGDGVLELANDSAPASPRTRVGSADRIAAPEQMAGGDHLVYSSTSGEKRAKVAAMAVGQSIIGARKFDDLTCGLAKRFLKIVGPGNE